MELEFAVMNSHDCHELRDAIGEYAMGEKAELFPGEKEKVESHLAVCDACREKVEHYRLLHRCLPVAFAMHAKSKGVCSEDSEDFQRAKDRIMTAVRQRIRETATAEEKLAQEENTAPESAPEATSRPVLAVAHSVEQEEGEDDSMTQKQDKIIRTNFRWTAAGAAAVLLLAGAYILQQGGLPGLEHGSATESPTTQSLAQAASGSEGINGEVSNATDKDANPAESTLSQRFDAADTPEAALALLQEAYRKWEEAEANATNKQQPELDELVVLTEGLIARWPGSDAVGEAYKLQSQCWESLGEAQRAKDAYIAFADFKAARQRAGVLAATGSEASADAAARQMVFEQVRDKALDALKDKDFTSVAYADVLIARYPGTEPARFGQYVVGRYNYTMGQDEEAVRAYEKLFAEDPDGKWAKSALGSYASALINTNHGAKAAKVWQMAAEETQDRHAKANYLFNSAVAALPPHGDIALALELFRKVEKEYADTGFAKYARNEMNRLNERMMKEIMPMEDVLKNSGI